MNLPPYQRFWTTLGVAAAAVALASCASQTDGAARPTGAEPATSTSSAPPSSATPAPAASVVLSPVAHDDVSPVADIGATVSGGRVTSAQLVNTATKLVVHGSLSSDATRWHATQALGYGKHYRLTVTATNADGKAVTRRTAFETLTPDAQNSVAIDTVYGNAIDDGGTYGVGMIVVASFANDVTDKAAAEKALQVTTSTQLSGAWHWLDDRTAHWRPQHFYAPGTKVTVAANIYGVDLGGGTYGASDERTSFVIGARHISIADDTTHQVKVYFDGTLQRTMPTSMGKHEGEYVDGRYISFWTMDGTYTVIGHENPAIMSSASYGLPADGPGGYGPEAIYWSTKISTDGIYLHELDSTVPYQGHSDTSHGCLNLNHDNAAWFFTHSRVGDVVIVKHNGGPKIALWQGGDWSVPWRMWVSGS